jgi:hypothetical protein
MDESQDAAVEGTNDEADDGLARQLAAGGWAKLAEFIGELRREVAETGDPVKRAHLKELEAATNMTLARRVMGTTMMHKDRRYPAPDVYAKAAELIGAVSPSAGYGIGGHTVKARMLEWEGTLAFHEWYEQKTWLAASIKHAEWLGRDLLGEPGREADAATFRQLGIDLARLEKKALATSGKHAGRGKTTFYVNGQKIKDLRRGIPLSQIEFIGKACSPDLLQKAENENLATDKTLTAICKKFSLHGVGITSGELKKTPNQADK